MMAAPFVTVIERLWLFRTRAWQLGRNEVEPTGFRLAMSLFDRNHVMESPHHGKTPDFCQHLLGRHAEIAATAIAVRGREVMEPSRYGGRAAILSVIAMLLVVYFAHHDWYVLNAIPKDLGVTLLEPPPATYADNDARDVVHWTGVLIWASLFLALGFLGSIFKDERGLSIIAGAGAVAVALVALVYLGLFFERALSSEQEGDLGGGWYGTICAVAILGAAVGIRSVVVVRNLEARPPSAGTE